MYFFFHLKSLMCLPLENTRGKHDEGHTVVKTLHVFRHKYAPAFCGHLSRAIMENNVKQQKHS